MVREKSRVGAGTGASGSHVEVNRSVGGQEQVSPLEWHTYKLRLAGTI